MYLSHDRMSRGVLWNALERKEACITYIRAIKYIYVKYIYDGVMSRARTQDVALEDFPITIELHQGPI